MKLKLTELIKEHRIKPNYLIDCGAYKGEYAELFNCERLLFEPNPERYKILQEKFFDNPNVFIEKIALGLQDTWRQLYLSEEGTSFYKEWNFSSEMIEVKVMPLSRYLTKIPEILKINCEGAEYEILEDLENHKRLSLIPELLVQFHKIPGYKKLYPQALRWLQKSHERIYKNKGWELWVLKK